MDTFITIVVLAILGFLGYSAVNDYNERNLPRDTGRYQIVTQGDYRAFLLDTSTGQTYSWTAIIDEKGKVLNNEWRYDYNSAIELKTPEHLR